MLLSEDDEDPDLCFDGLEGAFSTGGMEDSDEVLVFGLGNEVELGGKGDVFLVGL